MEETTITALQAWGCDTAGALHRIFDDVPLFAELLEDYTPRLALEVEKLCAAAERGDAETAFGIAHKNKGALGNLGLAPIYQPMNAVTEVFRGGTCENTGVLLAEISQRTAELCAILKRPEGQS